MAVSQAFRSGWLQIFITLLGIAVTIMIFMVGLNLQKKELSVIYEGGNSLIRLGGDLKGSVEVTYQGRAIDSLSKVNILVRNTGSVPITEDEIREPLIIQFSPQTNILSVTVERTTPKFSFSTVSTTNTVEYTFPLLNPADEAELAIFLQG